MKERKEAQPKKSMTPDWLVQGTLTKLGEMFDRLTGRRWNSLSKSATSRLIEKLKALIDSEVRETGADGKFAPHNLKLKIQWGKFSTDSEADIQKLKHEILIAAIDHINDRRYHTYAPLHIEIETDYFIEGIRLLGSFGKYAGDDESEAAINMTIPTVDAAETEAGSKIPVALSEEEIEQDRSVFIVKFLQNGDEQETELDFTYRKRVSVGRSKENDLYIGDNSVSRRHASLVLNLEKNLMVADIGSTNGTFVNEKRISCGKAFMIEDGLPIKFGEVKVVFERISDSLNESVPRKYIKEDNIAATEAATKMNGQQSNPHISAAEAFASLDKAVPPPIEIGTGIDVAAENREMDLDNDLSSDDIEEDELPERSNEKNESQDSTDTDKPGIGKFN